MSGFFSVKETLTVGGESIALTLVKAELTDEGRIKLYFENSSNKFEPMLFPPADGAEAWQFEDFKNKINKITKTFLTEAEIKESKIFEVSSMSAAIDIFIAELNKKKGAECYAKLIVNQKNGFVQFPKTGKDFIQFIGSTINPVALTTNPKFDKYTMEVEADDEDLPEEGETPVIEDGSDDLPF